jgi:hypothetical protein
MGESLKGLGTGSAFAACSFKKRGAGLELTNKGEHKRTALLDGSFILIPISGYFVQRDQREKLTSVIELNLCISLLGLAPARLVSHCALYAKITLCPHPD